MLGSWVECWPDELSGSGPANAVKTAFLAGDKDSWGPGKLQNHQSEAAQAK